MSKPPASATSSSEDRRIAAARVDDLIRRLVLEGFYGPGARISDYKLAQQLSVGRRLIRESFQRLAMEGILTIIPNRGAFVTELDPERVVQLTEAREAVEVEAVRLAAVRSSPEDLAPLREAIEVSRLALVQHGGQYPSDLDFHESVVALARNEYLSRVAVELNSQLRVARSRSAHSPNRAKAAVDEHLSILDAIESRDPLAAEHAMRRHLAASRVSLHQAQAADTTASATS